MAKIRVSRRFSFDAAHYLPDYPGKCANLHGHRWEVEITVADHVSRVDGMAFDFSKLREIVEPWIEKLDHQLLNDHVSMPTAENLTLWFVDCWYSAPRFATLVGVKVWEGPETYVEWRIEDE